MSETTQTNFSAVHSKHKAYFSEGQNTLTYCFSNAIASSNLKPFLELRNVTSKDVLSRDSDRL
ncbi:MAG: hypothetical protein KME12_06750 [Trichocoleus desertorum ATA4-8-CV12]|nr:hypothetical protein [Trichocoleus desertorum ATA4-8-CV12]